MKSLLKFHHQPVANAAPLYMQHSKNTQVLASYTIANNLLLAVVSHDTCWSWFEMERLANTNRTAFKRHFTNKTGTFFVRYCSYSSYVDCWVSSE